MTWARKGPPHEQPAAFLPAITFDLPWAETGPGSCLRASLGEGDGLYGRDRRFRKAYRLVGFYLGKS